jgi:uncharacterized protein with PIN domain
MERFRDVEKAIFERHWTCANCDGEMVGVSFGHAGHGNDWLHRCNKCGHEAWSAEHYPHLIYRDKP